MAELIGSSNLSGRGSGSGRAAVMVPSEQFDLRNLTQTFATTTPPPNQSFTNALPGGNLMTCVFADGHAQSLNPMEALGNGTNPNKQIVMWSMLPAD